MRRETAAKFFVKANGDTTIEKKGTLTEKEIGKIRKFIKEHYQEMFVTWSSLSNKGFYEGK